MELRELKILKISALVSTHLSFGDRFLAHRALLS